jgi:hypothetical protein
VRITALVLAIVAGLACFGVSITVSWQDGPGPEALAGGVLFWIAAALAWWKHRFRLLAIVWGLFLGVWFVLMELYWDLFASMTDGGFVSTVNRLSMGGLISAAAVTAIALLGLATTLVAPARDP